MFTIEQIEELHERLGKAETLADYVRSLSALGVARYDSFVADGHSEYLGHDGHRVISHAVHNELTVAQSSDRGASIDHLRRHEQGETSYLEMSSGLADSGIEPKLHLHARRIVIPHPAGAANIDVTAPLPEHMRRTWELLGLDARRFDADREG